MTEVQVMRVVLSSMVIVVKVILALQKMEPMMVYLLHLVSNFFTASQ